MREFESTRFGLGTPRYPSWVEASRPASVDSHFSNVDLWNTSTRFTTTTTKVSKAKVSPTFWKKSFLSDLTAFLNRPYEKEIARTTWIYLILLLIKLIHYSIHAIKVQIKMEIHFHQRYPPFLTIFRTSFMVSAPIDSTVNITSVSL